MVLGLRVWGQGLTIKSKKCFPSLEGHMYLFGFSEQTVILFSIVQNEDKQSYCCIFYIANCDHHTIPSLRQVKSENIFYQHSNFFKSIDMTQSTPKEARIVSLTVTNKSRMFIQVKEEM